ncbi:MAG: CCA tRNA nucleotidyltransferase [Ruminococcus sp.]|nr:CCA tRNA nucleotidyltransferase [Ruminococcus sp.]
MNDKDVDEILERLESCGYEAYTVGGCVRDTVMGRSAHDTDITTNALPEQIMTAFSDCKVVPTGLKHGTVTILKNNIPYEITTYRIDGEYKDSRRPENVVFTASLTEDLARRDFTMNAIAMDRHGNIADPFGGKADIADKLIRCVGDPVQRFTEDALRIMRAVRFASQLGFRIEEKTAEAVHAMKDRLKNISMERIRSELDKLLCGKNCVEVLLEYSDVITAIIPELAPSVGFDQHSPYHKYDVWEHTVRAVSYAPADNVKMRTALLFHDIAKPVCAAFDEDGRGHFKKHAPVGAEMTQEIMKRMKYDSETIAYAVMLIARHSKKVFDRIAAKKMMADIGDELFFELMELKKCDNLAKNDFVLAENELFDRLMDEGRSYIENNVCRGLRHLAVNGRDMTELGLQGREIGEALNEILNLVLEERLKNIRDDLLNYAKQRWQK